MENIPLLDSKDVLTTCEKHLNTGLSTLAIIGGILSFLCAFANLFGGVTNLPLHIYAMIFALVVLILETSRALAIPQIRTVLDFQLTLEHWVKALTTTWGRGCLYIFEGSLLLSDATFISFIVAAYMFGIGVFAFVLAATTGRKLAAIKKRLMIMNSGDEATKKYIESKFDEYDLDKNGRIDAKELQNLALQLKNPLSAAEAETALRILDPDHSGAIDKNEWMIWWKTKASVEYV